MWNEPFLTFLYPLAFRVSHNFSSCRIWRILWCSGNNCLFLFQTVGRRKDIIKKNEVWNLNEAQTKFSSPKKKKTQKKNVITVFSFFLLTCPVIPLWWIVMQWIIPYTFRFFSTTLSAKYRVFRITVTWCLKRNIANSPLHTSFPMQSCLLRKMDNQCFLEWLQPEMTMKLN